MPAIFTDRVTPIGLVRVVEQDGAITHVDLSSADGFVERQRGEAGTSALLRAAVQRLDEYFARARTVFDLPYRAASSRWRRGRASPRCCRRSSPTSAS